MAGQGRQSAYLVWPFGGSPSTCLCASPNVTVISSGLGLVAVVFHAAALVVFRGGDVFAAFDGHTREAIGMLVIRMHGSGDRR